MENRHRKLQTFRRFFCSGSAAEQAASVPAMLEGARGIFYHAASVAVTFSVVVSGLLTGSLTDVCRADDSKPGSSATTFEKHVLPILKSRCVKCHAGAEPKAELRLTSRREILRGGQAGPAIRIAAAESSLLWEMLAGNQMPQGGPPLTADEKGVIRSWINEGALTESSADGHGMDNVSEPASDDQLLSEHWSFRPPVRPEEPAVMSSERVTTPVDRFLLAALESRGLTYSDTADPDVLLRRASFDLVGLPPTPDEIRMFRGEWDMDPAEAWRTLIDRLLDSPHYGERWGRHWLDVAGYADSAGVLAEDRPLQTAFRYRDYVIRSFNSDKPYDQFLQEQIAGDELSDYWTADATLDQLPDEVVEAITATGFLRCAPDSSRPDFSTIKNADAQYYYPTLNDTLQIVASSTIGLTLQCARCHSHKFDPLPQTDYYRLQAIFTPALRPSQWIPQMERRLLIATASQRSEAEQKNGQIDEAVKSLNADLAGLKERYQRQLTDDRMKALPETVRSDFQAAVAAEPASRTPIQAYLVEKFQLHLHPDAAALEQQLPEVYPEYRQERDQKVAAIADHERQRIHFDELRCLYDLPGDVVTPLLHRGDPLTPGPPVEPGVPAALRAPVPFIWSKSSPEAKTTGRRLAFARWLTQLDHPLTARVIVNRVWLHHFGEGIVSTPEDFGVLGAAPSHPELLDWLAREFVEGGWSFKKLHRLIMTSTAYRQKSGRGDGTHAAAVQADPENRLLWRQNLRRLEAEPIRDAMLSVSGLLDRQLFGVPMPMARRADGEVTTVDGAVDRRRSIYLQVLRSNPLTLLQSFDQPVMETNCVRRIRSTVATQALTLLNSESTQQHAQAFADRLLKEAPDTPADYAILCAFSRSSSPDESTALLDFLAVQQTQYQTLGDAVEIARKRALTDLCQMLMASNEFVYVD